jgi:hypothetical protein
VTAIVAAALRALRRITAGLADAAPDERRRLLALQAEALGILETHSGRSSSEELAQRIQRLEAQMRDRSPGERRQVICQRLGISRATYYRARSLTQVRLPAARMRQ